MGNKIKHKDQPLEILWKQFVKGDMISFRIIFENQYRSLFNFGLKYVSDNVVEDCIQNMFLYLLQNRESYPKVKNVKAYLIISLRNQIFSHKKVEKNNIVLLKSLIYSEETSYSNAYLEKNIQLLLNKLSPREKEIVILKYFQDYKNKEIAVLLNIKYQTVRNILHNAFVKIKDADTTRLAY